MNSQLLLNGMLPPVGGGASAIEDNEDVFRVDINILDGIVCECQQQGKDYNVQSAFATLVPMLNRYTKQGKELPFLFKQVIFYLAVHCMKYKANDLNWTQDNILAFLDGAGVSFSHNFFTRLGYTPTMYLRDMPEHFINYMGQKHEELGVAIRNLAWQAGNYGVFYDLFGGSGSASLAVNKSSDKWYVYNELNKSVYNLMYVVKDDILCSSLVIGVKILRDYLINGGQQYGKMNLQNCLQKMSVTVQKTKRPQEHLNIIQRGLSDMQARAYAYYSYFMDLLDDPASIPLNRVDHAMAEIFRQFFMTRNTSKSSVLSTLKTRPGRIKSFGNDAMIASMNLIHKEFKKIILSNQSFETFFKKKYLLTDVLYYVDPPYIATTDYPDKANGVNAFLGEDMEQLIKGLIESKKHFIFSCRAVKGVEKGNLYSSTVFEDNLKHLKHMYRIFNQYILDNKVETFYVLAIETISNQMSVIHPELQMGTLPQKIDESDFIELFITDFKIAPFIDERYPEKKFTVYDFAELSQFLMSYMNV